LNVQKLNEIKLTVKNKKDKNEEEEEEEKEKEEKEINLINFDQPKQKYESKQSERGIQNKGIKLDSNVNKDNIKISMSDRNNKGLTLDQLKINNGEFGKRLWILIDGNIYDVTDFNHPGGINVFKEKIGRDRMNDFTAAHGTFSSAHSLKKKYLVGPIQK